MTRRMLFRHTLLPPPRPDSRSPRRHLPPTQPAAKSCSWTLLMLRRRARSAGREVPAGQGVPPGRVSHRAGAPAGQGVPTGQAVPPGKGSRRASGPDGQGVPPSRGSPPGKGYPPGRGSHRPRFPWQPRRPGLPAQ